MSNWITEQASVLQQEGDVVWVAAERTSACSACRAKSGCGTALLAKLGNEQVVVRALLDESLQGLRFYEGERVELAVDRYAFVKAALIMYLTPLVGLVIAVIATLGMGELVSIVAAALGLLLGGWLASIVLKRRHDDPSLQPVIIARVMAVDGAISVEEPLQWQAPARSVTKP